MSFQPVHGVENGAGISGKNSPPVLQFELSHLKQAELSEVVPATTSSTSLTAALQDGTVCGIKHHQASPCI